MSTVRFAEASITDYRGDHVLHFDGNSKITAGNGTFDCPAANAFSLVEVDDCPGSTPTCRAACYVQGLRTSAPEVHARFEHNSRTIREILAGPRDLWAALVGEWISDNAAAGFRWHVSGDIFSLDYAHWIASVVVGTPKVRHWIYTRSHGLIAPLLGLPNIAINLSADRDNLWSARMARAGALAKHGQTLRIAYMVTGDGYVPRDLPTGSVLFPDYGLRTRANEDNPAGEAWWAALPPAHRRMICPVDQFGASEHLRCGPCTKCTKG